MTETAGQKQRPGNRLMVAGLVTLVLGLVLLVFNLTNPVTNYVAGVGMVTTKSPSVAAIILLVAGLVLAVVGFAKRILAAVEKR